MAGSYHIDLERFSLERFRRILEAGELLPGRQILKEDLAGHFAALESEGIHNLKELMDALKTKARLQSTARESGVPEEYLTVLRREVNSYVPKPDKLADIPGLDPEQVGRLKAVGINNTKQLFERAWSEGDRAELSRLTDVPGDALSEMVALSDLARIGGVGPVFARMLLDLGVDSPESVLAREPEELLEAVNAVNREKGYANVTVSIKDIHYCISKAEVLVEGS
jgi:predicted flap endonuclease-1-like 5' DNA nuclease